MVQCKAWAPRGGRGYVATLPTSGPLLILSPALKRRGSPRRQGLCSHLAHKWATWYSAARSKAYYRLRLNSVATPTTMNPSTNLPARCKVLDCRKWHCTYAMPHNMPQAHPVVSHDYAGCSEEEKTKVWQAFDNFQAPLPPKAKLPVPPALPTVLPALLSGPNQGSSSSGSSSSSNSTTNASSNTSASSAVVPRQALVTMCHRNPCLMGRQPAGSQDRKQPGQRSVLDARVPARGHATSGRMIPMLEAPPLPSLLYIYICVCVCVCVL